MMQSTEINSAAFEENPLTVRTIFRVTQESISYLLSKWLWIISVGIVIGLTSLLFVYSKKTTYKAVLTFAVDEGSSRDFNSNFSNFSEQLGLGPIDGGMVFSNSNNIKELLKSRLLIERVLRDSAMVYGKKLLFADFFLDSLEFRDKWIVSEGEEKFLFNKKKKTHEEEVYENGLIRGMYKLLSGQMIEVKQLEKSASITTVSCNSENELFSKYFLEALIEEVIQYYIDSKTQRSRENLKIIQMRTDSVREAYVSAAFGKAAFSDADLNLVRQTVAVPGEKKQTDVQILRTAYIELSRNLESAKTSLMNETPVIQLIDTPILPLDSNKTSLFRQFLIFSVIGAFLTIIWLLVRKAIKYYRGDVEEEDVYIYEETIS